MALAVTLPSSPESPLSSSDGSFMTATQRPSCENPVTPSSHPSDRSTAVLQIVDNPERPSTPIAETWTEWAGIASLLHTLTGELNTTDDPGPIPQITIDDSTLSSSPSSAASSSPRHSPNEPLLLPLSTTSDHPGACSLEQRGPFQKWIDSLHRRASHRSRRFGHSRHTATNGFEDGFHIHSKSSSGSSFAFVSAVKSASIGIGSVTTNTRSRPGTMHSRSRTDRSSRLSAAPPRFSEDSTHNNVVLGAMDKAGISRSIQRRSILEELIATEENYIGDVRFLINVSRPFLSS